MINQYLVYFMVCSFILLFYNVLIIHSHRKKINYSRIKWGENMLALTPVNINEQIEFVPMSHLLLATVN